MDSQGDNDVSRFGTILMVQGGVHLSFQILDPAKWERFVDFSTVLFTIYLLFFGLVNMPLNWEVIQPDMARFLYAVYTLLAFVITVFLVIHIM
eukprot:g33213.t1